MRDDLSLVFSSSRIDMKNYDLRSSVDSFVVIEWVTYGVGYVMIRKPQGGWLLF